MSTPLPEVPNPRYVPTKILGKGAYASVVAATDTKTNQTVAIKIIKRTPPGMPINSELRTIQQLHKEARNPYIVYPLDSFTKDGACYIVMDMLTGGDLYSRVKPNGPGLSKSEAKQWIYQLCVATQAVHANGYVHADIKPENCLISDDGCLVLADFGLCVRNGYCHFCNVPGTEAYMSPELLGRGKKGTIITTAVDSYAIGMTWYAMLFADLPWDVAAPRDPEFRDFVASGRLPGPAKAIGMLSSELYALLVRMLAPVPTSRPSLNEVLRFLSTNQPWFVNKKATASQRQSAKPKRSAAAETLRNHPAPAFAVTSASPVSPAPHHAAAVTGKESPMAAIPAPEQTKARRSSQIH